MRKSTTTQLTTVWTAAFLLSPIALFYSVICSSMAMHRLSGMSPVLACGSHTAQSQIGDHSHDDCSWHHKASKRPVSVRQPYQNSQEDECDYSCTGRCKEHPHAPPYLLQQSIRIPWPPRNLQDRIKTNAQLGDDGILSVLLSTNALGGHGDPQSNLLEVDCLTLVRQLHRGGSSVPGISGLTRLDQKPTASVRVSGFEERGASWLPMSTITKTFSTRDLSWGLEYPISAEGTEDGGAWAESVGGINP